MHDTTREKIALACSWGCSVLAAGIAFAWYSFSDLWDVPVRAAAGRMECMPQITLLTSAVIFVVLAVAAGSRERLDTRKARRAVGAFGAVSCCVPPLLVGLFSYGIVESFAAHAMFVGASSLSYALILCFWMQTLHARSSRALMGALAAGFVAAAGVAVAFSGARVPAAAAMALPFVAFGLCCAARLCARGCRATSDGEQRASRSFSRIPIVTVYTVLMGLSTTQFHTLIQVSDPQYAKVGMLLAAGAIVLFVAMFMYNVLDADWCMLLSGVVFAAVIAMWLAVPSSAEAASMIAGSLHWAALILPVAAVFDPGRVDAGLRVSRACWSMALFYMAAGLGGASNLLGVYPQVALCVTTTLVVVVTLVVARVRSAASQTAASDQAALPQVVRDIETPAGSDGGSCVCEASSSEAPVGLRSLTPIEERLAAVGAESGLTPREMEVCALLAEGNSLRHIAESLVLSENTVKRHRTNVYRKTGVSSRQELIDLVHGD